MFKKKFFFIAFEGVEGTGKSYQIDRLHRRLKKKKFKVIKTREPGGSKTAEKIRSLIFNKSSNTFHFLTDFYLMLASRNEHINKTILLAKKNKTIVITDRFTDSTYAYQSIGQGISKKINDINKEYILKKLKPNLTIVLKSSFNSIFLRLKKRKNKNRYDKLNKKFYIKIQNTFINLSKANKKSYLLFDSSQNDKKLEEKIFNCVIKKINNAK
jgi:dTMP kinase